MMWKPEIDLDALPPGLADRLAQETPIEIDPWSHGSFVSQTQSCFNRQRHLARVAGEPIDYGVEDLRHLVRNHLGERHCYFCRGPITPDNFAIVARIPPERGGSFGFHNLEVVCAPCGQAKGALDRIEFRELHDLLRSWSPFVRRYFLTRLRTGVCRNDLLFRRPNRTIRPTEQLTLAPPPDDERPGALE